MEKNKTKSSKTLLLELLREKQKREGLGYITTKSTPYKIFRYAFLAMVIICIFINLFYILGKSGEMAANLANMDKIEPHQQIEIDRLYTTIGIMIASTVGLLLSEIFIWFKLPILQLIFCFGSSITIILRLSLEIKDTTSNVLVNHHILPLVILCVCCAVSAGFHIRQLYKDKKGCNALSELIYKKYSKTATDISPEQWENIISEYKYEGSKSKKRSVKDRLKKQKQKEISENAELNPTDTMEDKPEE